MRGATIVVWTSQRPNGKRQWSSLGGSVAKTPFPHMFPRDVPLFASFVVSGEANKFDAWTFDDRVGIPRDPGPGFDPTMREMAIWLSYLRIDAVGYQSGSPTIFEVKPSARISALGQLIAYKHFWDLQRGTIADLAIITDNTDPTMTALWREFGVHLYLVQPAGPEKIIQARQRVYGNSAV